MKRVTQRLPLVAVLFVASAGYAQQSTSNASQIPSATAPTGHLSTVRGCLDGDRGNYVVVDNNGMAYVLKGVGNKLDSQIHHEVEVTGKMLPGSVKSGVRPEKQGSNPSDTVHGIDAVPFQVGNVDRDIRTISKHCKAADQE
jgi:hypothetical protein